jgi:hypothetical protein
LEDEGYNPAENPEGVKVKIRGNIHNTEKHPRGGKG